MCDCLFSSHLRQWYHDLRISVDKRLKISKGVKVDSLWNSSFGSSEKIFGGPSLGSSEKLSETSNPYRLCIQFIRRGSLNRTWHLQWNILSPLGLIHLPPLPRSYSPRFTFHHTFLSPSLNGARIAFPLTPPPRRLSSSPSVTTHSRASLVWGRASLLIDGPQEQKKEGEPRGVST
jgi:hypothetical protein